MSSSVAIITRTQNRPLLLNRAIQGVLNQKYTNWIHIIVNDGGDLNNIKNIVTPYTEAYADRIKIISNENQKGMEAASNIGIISCQSDYILIHDDDDSIESNFLSEAVEYLDNPPHPNIYGVVSLVNVINEKIIGDKIIETNRTIFRNLELSIRIDDIAKSNPIPNISFLFKRCVFDEIGMYDEKLPVLGDWDFNLRFIEKYDIGVIQKPLVNYHHRPSILSGNMGNTVHAQINKHEFYDALVRNRFFRHASTRYLGLLLQTHNGKKDILHLITELESTFVYKIISILYFLPGLRKFNRIFNLLKKA